MRFAGVVLGVGAEGEGVGVVGVVTVWGGEEGGGGGEGGVRVGVFGGGGVVGTAAEEFGAGLGCLLDEC